MNLKLIPTPEFSRSVKKLYKKYRLITKDLKILENELITNPKSGIELGNNSFKVRIPNSSIPTGKRGGFRVVYYYKDQNDNIYLLAIYSKTDLENISHRKLADILERNGLQ
ncbi:MAG: type II toxin-antitoxin system RelE/ParE family toxin [Spirochaetales bacterium]|nr:type II toxin-antitoxin system RelE/ParE family toxin [Spirochaetales bacterium]